MDRSGSRFPPLTESELAARPALPVDVGWVPIVPVPQGVKLPRSLVDRMCPPGHSFCATWSYTTPGGGISSVVVRYNSAVGGKKEFRPFTYCRDAAGRCEWQCQALPEPRPLYNLDQFVAHDAPVLIVEGEKSADAAALIFQDYVVTTNSGGAKAFGKADWSPLAGRDVSIWPDHDEPGAQYANGVAALAHKAGARTVRIVAVPGDFPHKWDLANPAPESADVHVLLDGAGAVELPRHSGEQGIAGGEAGSEGTAGNGAAHDDDFSGPDKIDLEIVRLAKLPTIDYERTRLDAASKLGLRATILDRLVAAERPGTAPGSGRPLELATPEPWPESVNGAALVTELTGVIRKYVVLTENDGLTVALWVLHSYCFDTFPCTPRLAITAPEKRCGKTTLLDVIALLVRKALATANISAAATFRTIEVARPTLLIDEADTFLGENEELRGILNSGHRAGGQVIRTVGDDFEARSFSTHCPVAIAQIGKLPDTLADRSIHISMKRLAPGETVARFRLGRTPELVEVAMKAARWVADNADAIRACDPAIPDAIFNRAADNWEPLLAIAEVAGGDIPERAKKAALEACGIEEELSFRAMLLADIRGAFKEKSCDRMSSADLVAALVAMADRPWGECSRGKALTQNQLARKLKDFGINPKKIRFPSIGTAQGYELAAFADSFSRYIPALSTGTLEQSNNISELSETQRGTRLAYVPVQNQPNSLNTLDCSGVPVETTESGARAQSSGNVSDEKAANPRIGRIEPQSSDTVGNAWEDGF